MEENLGTELIKLATEMQQKRAELERQGIDPKTYDWTEYNPRISELAQRIDRLIPSIKVEFVGRLKDIIKIPGREFRQLKLDE